MRILMIGDVIGRPGRMAVRGILPGLRQRQGIDMVIANGENAAGGIGLTIETAEELFHSGVDVITSGNHIWHHKELIPHLDGDAPILRPLNYPPGVPGRGYLIRGQVMVVSLMGRTFIAEIDCPFRAMDSLLEGLDNKPAVIVVDFHGEATSEKGAMGWYLDGRVSAVVGTHTHIGTIDARVLPQGTAFITDVGMVGPKDSIIGDDVHSVLERFLTQIPRHLSVGKGPVTFNSVLVQVNEEGRAVDIARIDLDWGGV